MSFCYYVAIDARGIAGVAATKQSAAVEAAAESGAEVFPVDAPNAFQARRAALAVWRQRGGLAS